MNAELAKVDPFKAGRERIEGERPEVIEFEISRFDLMRLHGMTSNVEIAVFVHEANAAGYTVDQWERWDRNAIAFRLKRPKDAVVVVSNPLRAGAIDV